MNKTAVLLFATPTALGRSTSLRADSWRGRWDRRTGSETSRFQTRKWRATARGIALTRCQGGTSQGKTGSIENVRSWAQDCRMDLGDIKIDLVIELAREVNGLSVQWAKMRVNTSTRTARSFPIGGGSLDSRIGLVTRCIWISPWSMVFSPHRRCRDGPRTRVWSYMRCPVHIIYTRLERMMHLCSAAS